MKLRRKARTKPTMPPLEVLREAEYVTIEQLAVVEPAFTPAAIRWHIFHSLENGLDKSGAIIRIGRKILIKPRAWRAWLEKLSRSSGRPR